MVKRQQIKPGATVRVVKLMPTGSHAGPSFRGDLELNEELTVQSTPFSRGPLNLVSVKRKNTGEQTELIYAFITNFCKLVEGGRSPPSPKSKE